MGTTELHGNSQEKNYLISLYFSVFNSPSNAQFQELISAAAESGLLLPHE